MSPRTKTAIAAGVASAVIFVLLMVQRTFINGVWMALRSNMGFWLIFLATLAAVALAVRSYSKTDRSYSYSRTRGEAKTYPIVPFVLAAILGVIGCGFMLSYASYAKAKQVHESVAVVQPEGDVAAVPEYKYRAPFSIGAQQIQDNTTINGDPQAATYIPELDKFGAPVIRKGFFKGYGQVVWKTIGETGQATGEPCTFTEAANDRLGGWLHTNLERRIIAEDFGIKIDSSDAYAYCNEANEPVVVVPFTKYEGFLFPIEVPAGVALYNGATDELEVLHDVDPGQVPGPVYPLSLSEAARAATTSTDGWWNHMFANVGFTEYGGENSGDYTLRKTDDEADAFVTPLTPIGRGKAITAVGYVPSNEVSAGKLNPYTIAVLPEPRQGDGAVADRVRADYGDINWDSGLEVFEVTPTGPDKWAATVGLNKSIVYRLEINADASSCLFNTRGVKLRCSGDEEADPSVPTPSTGDPLDLGSLSDEDLLALQEQVMEEVADRLVKGEAAAE